jgi:hypothetical protein
MLCHTAICDRTMVESECNSVNKFILYAPIIRRMQFNALITIIALYEFISLTGCLTDDLVISFSNCGTLPISRTRLYLFCHVNRI